MQITPSTVPVQRRDLTIQEGVLQQRVTILPGYQTRCGTPLIPEKNAWRPVKPGETALMFASGPNQDERIIAFKAMIVETWVPDLQVGPVSIKDVADNGSIQFVNDPSGPYLALTPSRVFLG